LQKIEILRARIAELEEELRQLRADIAPTNDAFAGILTVQQTALLNSIKSRKVSTYAYIDQVLASSGNFNRKDGADLERVRSKVSIYNLRKKLNPHGIEIATWRGIGYYMTDANKEKLLKLMEKKDERS